MKLGKDSSTLSAHQMTVNTVYQVCIPIPTEIILIILPMNFLPNRCPSLGSVSQTNTAWSCNQRE